MSPAHVGANHAAARPHRQIQARPAGHGADVEQRVPGRQAQTGADFVHLRSGGVAVGPVVGIQHLSLVPTDHVEAEQLATIARLSRTA